MKILNKISTIFIVAILLFSCSKDNDPTTDDPNSGGDTGSTAFNQDPGIGHEETNAEGVSIFRYRLKVDENSAEGDRLIVLLDAIKITDGIINKATIVDSEVDNGVAIRENSRILDVGSGFSGAPDVFNVLIDLELPGFGSSTTVTRRLYVTIEKIDTSDLEDYFVTSYDFDNSLAPSNTALFEDAESISVAYENNALKISDYDSTVRNILIPFDDEGVYYGSYTVSFDFKFTGTQTRTNADLIIGNSNGGLSALYDITINGVNRINTIEENAFLSASLDQQDVDNEEWFTYTGVYDSNALKVSHYINGVNQGSQDLFSPAFLFPQFPEIDGMRNFNLGTARDSPPLTIDDSFVGLIDNLKFYNKALSDAEVLNIQ